MAPPDPEAEVKVRIGITDIAREIELDIEDIDAFQAEVERSIDAKDALLWVVDTEGHRVGIPAARIGFIDIAPEGRMTAGFR
jgi:hypothetical protein